MSWDYIVIGAGSAGCALTRELVTAGHRVLVLEAGGADRSPFIKVAAGQLRACAAHDWGYRSQPDPTRNGAAEDWIRGRVLGGSSSINGTVYTRGVARDFDRWKIPGWTWQDVLPIFRTIEHSDQPGELRGHGGPLHIRTVRRPHPISRAFVDSARATGLPFVQDYNGPVQEGVSYAQLTQRGGFRCSAADAFLKPLLGRPNLQLLLNALVQKIEVTDGRATGVLFTHRGETRREQAERIVLCAGTINSPQLLMRSGIGDPQELGRHGIDVVHSLPGVGQHLKEQPMVSLSYRTRVPTYSLTEGWSQKLAIAAKFLFTGEGPVSNLFEGAAFLRSSPAAASPDLQVLFMAVSYVILPDGRYQLASYPSIMAHVMSSYPLSEGRVRLRSADPAAAPLIECRLLDSAADVDALVRGIRKVRRIMAHEPIASLLDSEVLPGQELESDEALRTFVREHAGISFHPIGTCRMGSDADAVVDPGLRVNGLENLWIADASVIPDQLSANLNAVAIMVGAKLGKQLTSG